MDTEIREWIIMIWEYCQEHWAAAIAAAVVLLILVISFFLVCTAKREDAKAQAQAEDLSAPEHEPEPAVEPTAEQSDEPALQLDEPQQSDESALQLDEPQQSDEAEPTAKIASEAVEAESMTEPAQLPTTEPALQAGEPQQADEPAPQPTAAEQEPMQAALTDAVMKQLVRQVEEVSAASGQKVESIELNIEKARLTIRYAEGSAAETDGTKPQPKYTLELQSAGASESVGARNFADTRGFGEENGHADGASDGARIRTGDGVEPQGDRQTEESVMPRKFGMENMNRAKSGRVYTEDELLSQIKD